MKDDTKIIGFNCEAELANLITTRASKEGKTTSEYVRDVLYSDLEGYEAADADKGGGPKH
jgi:hypothetical protein